MLSPEGIGFGQHVVRATIVPRRTGPGYRLVLGLRTEHGTHAPETLAKSFTTPGEARLFALRDLGLSATDVRISAEINAPA
jgi:hypothetical protein